MGNNLNIADDRINEKLELRSNESFEDEFSPNIHNTSIEENELVIKGGKDRESRWTLFERGYRSRNKGLNKNNTADGVPPEVAMRSIENSVLERRRDSNLRCASRSRKMMECESRKNHIRIISANS